MANKNLMKNLEIVIDNNNDLTKELNKVLLNKNLFFAHKKTKNNFEEIYKGYLTATYKPEVNTNFKDFSFKYSEKTHKLKITYNFSTSNRVSQIPFTFCESHEDNTCKEISVNEYLGIDDDDEIEETPIINDPSSDEEEPEEPEPKPVKKEKPPKMTAEEKKKRNEELKKQKELEYLKKRKEAEDARHKVCCEEKELFFAANPDLKDDYQPNGYTYTTELSHEVKGIRYSLKEYNKSGKTDLAKDVYNNKRYTMFLTESELDCIQEGLQLLKEKREKRIKKGANLPFIEIRSCGTLAMITERLNKIKNKVANKKINIENTSMKYELYPEDYEEEQQ